MSGSNPTGYPNGVNFDRSDVYYDARPNLPQNTDVDDGMAPADGEVLKYVASTNQWEAAPDATGVDSYATLTDTDITGRAQGSVQFWHDTNGKYESSQAMTILGPSPLLRDAGDTSELFMPVADQGNDTMVAELATQTLRRKTMTNPDNDVTARSLFVQSGAGSVSTYAAAAPTAGQVLEATSATTAAWVTPASIPTDHVTINTTQVLDASADKTYQATQSFVADKPIVFGSDAVGIAVTDNTAKEGVILGHNYTTFPGFADFEVLHYESPAGSNAPVVTIGAPASSSSLGPKTVRISTVPNYNSSAQTDVVTVTDKQMLIQDVAPTTAGPTTNNRAILELQSTTRGFLPPRMAGAPVPAAGLMYYNTTANEFSWYNGTVWVAPNDHVHDAADVTTGAFADARISASSVQQHPATTLKTATGTITVNSTDPPLDGAMLARTAAGVASWVRGVTSATATTTTGNMLLAYNDTTGTSAAAFTGAAGAGEIIYSTALDQFDTLPSGTSGHHLRSGGTGAPAWSASTLENHTDVTVVSKANNDVLAWSSGDGAWTNITREIAPSRTYGSYYVTTPAATTIGDSVNYFKFAGTTSLNLNSPGVSHIASNRIQYTGTATRVFSVEGTVSMSSTGANQTLSVAVFKNGVIDPASEQSRTFSNATDLEECSTHAQITLATNDYVELWVKNATSTNAVTAQHMSVMLSALS